MLSTKIDHISETVRARLHGRSRQVVAIATLAGVAAIGLAAATLDHTPSPSITAAVAEAHKERVEALDRANRATRESATAQMLAAPAAPAASPTEEAPKPAPEATTAAAPAPVVKAAAAFVHPMSRGELSSCFGPRWGTMHAGIDLFTDAGEPIVAVTKGTVVAAGWAYSGYGISVVVDHHNGYLTHYAHMRDDAVRVGQKVKAGDVLGYEGSTGDSTGPHLHFEVHAGMWRQINPAPWLRERGIDIGC